MKMPWENKSGLAKLAAFIAVALGIFLGLCGANTLAFVITNANLEDDHSLLVRVAAFDRRAIGICVGALVLVGLLMLLQSVYRTFTRR
jgi:hypothetical protein